MAYWLRISSCNSLKASSRVCLRSTLNTRCASTSRRATSCSALLGLSRVVAFAHLHLQVLVRHLDRQFAERAVPFRVSRGVSNGVLAAHFVLQFLEGVVEGMLAVHLKHPAAGLAGHLLQRKIADTERKHAIGAGIGVVD